MILRFIFWIATIVALPLIINASSAQWTLNSTLLFLGDIVLGIFFWISFVLGVNSHYHRVFGRKTAIALSALSLFGSLFAGTALAVALLAVNSRLYPSKLAPSTVVRDLSNSIENKYVLLAASLGMGATGEDVSLLQTLLYQDAQVYTGPASGYFGQITREGLVKFQKKHNLAPSGVTDEATNAKLNELYGSRPRSFWLGLIPTPAPAQENTVVQDQGPSEWGKSVRVPGTEHGWTMKVGMDAAMATPQEIFDALNKYRGSKGVHGLNWDGTLASYAQERASYLNSIGSTDDHAGFRSYLENSDNVKRLGFSRLGENISYGFRLNGTHIIEWMYAGDAPHDNNQLDPGWSDVGIGVSGTATAVIFGGSRF